jgi:hypothetical protein
MEKQVKSNEIVVIERGFDLTNEEMTLILGGVGGSTEALLGCGCKCGDNSNYLCGSHKSAS